MFFAQSPKDLALLCVYVVVAIDMLASALTVPAIPFYVEELCGCDGEACSDALCDRLGGSSSALGTMFSSFAIAQLLSSAWMGPLSDKVGRKAILTVTLGGAGLGILGSSMATSFVQLLASRVFIGACSGTMSACNAYIADISTPKERPSLMANVGTLVQLCFMFGPGVGAGLSAMDHRAPFWVGAAVSFGALLLTAVYMRTPEELAQLEAEKSKALLGDSPASKNGGGGNDQPAETDWRGVLVLAAGSLASNTAFSSLMTCQALYLNDIFGWGSLQYGFVMMGTATFSIIFRTGESGAGDPNRRTSLRSSPFA